MSKKIAIIGTLDNKGEQIKYLKDQIESQGHQAIVIDAGVLGKALFEPDISRQQVAQASGLGLEEISAFNDESKAIPKGERLSGMRFFDRMVGSPEPHP